MTKNILKSRGKFVYSMDVATSGAVMNANSMVWGRPAVRMVRGTQHTNNARNSRTPWCLGPLMSF
eukprot:scaffold22451_cov45-Attheya_sp.AAC.1